ncbi:MAG: glycosyltransferase family 2 protein, partial [Clostridia bacterium]|nr:glycosyltransferase family 2 protein [Clostridia bacterium]
MRISVALASYNGEKYIKEQLQSILDQTIPVDEIIVSDDGSKDSTVEIVKSFNDPRIILLQDNVNHGYTGNFEHALKHTTGDIIFLSDQDDVWIPNKVERHLSVFESNPDVGLIISDGIIIDKDGVESSEMLALNAFNATIDVKSTGILSRTEYLSTAAIVCLANGMALCVTKNALDKALPFPDCTIAHDHFICFTALNLFKVYYLYEPLVKYRIHGENVSVQTKNISFIKRLKRSTLRSYNLPYDQYNLSLAVLNQLDETNPDNEEAVKVTNEKLQVSLKQILALERNPFASFFCLCKLFFSDKKYKAYGKNYF